MNDILNFNLEVEESPQYDLGVEDADYDLHTDDRVVIIRKDTYIHTQYVAQDIWEIEHKLHKYPSVTIVDSGNNQVVGDVQYINEDKLKVIFTAPFSGKAYLN